MATKRIKTKYKSSRKNILKTQRLINSNNLILKELKKSANN